MQKHDEDKEALKKMPQKLEGDFDYIVGGGGWRVEAAPTASKIVQDSPIECIVTVIPGVQSSIGITVTVHLIHASASY